MTTVWPIFAGLLGALITALSGLLLWRAQARKLNAEAVKVAAEAVKVAAEADKVEAEAKAGVLTAAQAAYKDLYDEMRARDTQVRSDLSTAIGQISGFKDRLEIAENRQTQAEARERVCLAELATIKAVTVDRAEIEDLVNKRVRDAVDHGIASAVEAFGVK